MQFFELAGYPCPPLRNASDHYLQTINADFDRVTHELKALSHVSRMHQKLLNRGNTCFVSGMSKSGEELYHEPYSVATFESCIAKAESVGTPKWLHKLCVHIPESLRCLHVLDLQADVESLDPLLLKSRSTNQTIKVLSEMYRKSKYASATKLRIQELSKKVSCATTLLLY